MKKLASLLFALSLAYAAQAQYRYSLYTLATNTVPATVNSNYLSACAVGTALRADIQIAFSLTSSNGSAMSATCSNPVTATFDFGIDGTRYTNRFVYALNAQSNVNVWGMTNIWVTNAAWARLVSVTNANFAVVTNYSVKLGIKTGL